MVKFGDLNPTIIGGQIVKRVIADPIKKDEVVDEGRKTIVAKTVSEGCINEEGIVINNYKAEPDSKRLTREGDIVVKLSSPYNAVIIDRVHEGMLASSFCSIIRDIEGIDKNYLVAFLNSEVCQKQLESSVAGTVMSVLSNGKLAELEIPLPNEKKQKEIGDYFEKTIKNRILLAKIQKLEEEKLASMIANLEDEDDK